MQTEVSQRMSEAILGHQSPAKGAEPITKMGCSKFGGVVSYAAKPNRYKLYTGDDLAESIDLRET